MADKGVGWSSKLLYLPVVIAFCSSRPGCVELKAWKWVMHSLKVEF